MCLLCPLFSLPCVGIYFQVPQNQVGQAVFALAGVGQSAFTKEVFAQAAFNQTVYTKVKLHKLELT